MNTFTFSIYIFSPRTCARISYSPAAPLPQQSPATPCSASAPASAATCFKEEFACGSGECVSKVSCDWSTQWMLSSDWSRTTCATAPMTARTTRTRPDAGSWRGCSSGGRQFGLCYKDMYKYYKYVLCQGGRVQAGGCDGGGGERERGGQRRGVRQALPLSEVSRDRGKVRLILQ